MSVKQQDINGNAYSNELNDLDFHEFGKFLSVCTNIPINKNNAYAYLDDEVKPSEVIEDIVKFFTKENDLILDVFSGKGNNLIVYDVLGREAIGVELDTEKIEYYETYCSSDMLMRQFEVKNCLADKIDFEENTFDFVLIDPPYKKFPNTHTELERFPIPDYVKYLKIVLEKAIKSVKNGKYVCMFLNDAYNSGRYYNIPGLFDNMVGLKIYYKNLDIGNVGIAKCYAPKINHFYLAIFRKNNNGKED